MAESKFPPLFDQFKSMVVQGAKDLHNQIVPAFPAYAHGVDEAGTPQNLTMQPVEAAGLTEGKPSFEQSLASEKPPLEATLQPPEQGMEMGE